MQGLIPRFHRSFCCIIYIILLSASPLYSQPQPQHNLVFDSLAITWDEGIPLGNGIVGALVWQKGPNLRLSLDRADLWDMRPMKGLHRPEFSYKWVELQVQKKEYAIVQQYFDKPYDEEPAPTKIPGGALEFDIQNWGPIHTVELSVKEASAYVTWKNGIVLKTFVHATHPIGWFRLDNFSQEFTPDLVPPTYQGGPAQIADLTGEKLKTIISRKGYAVKHLRQRLEDLYNDFLNY